MDDSDPDQLGADAQKRALLASARREFADFYRRASTDDALLMDGLIMAHVALLTGINAPREGVPARLRSAVERTCDAAERVFTALRERVRKCPTFTTLSGNEQPRIESVILEVPLPWLQ